MKLTLSFEGTFRENVIPSNELSRSLTFLERPLEDSFKNIALHAEVFRIHFEGSSKACISVQLG